MPHPRVRLDPTDAPIPDGVLAALGDRFAAVRAELGLSLDYPAEALAEASVVAAQPPGLPKRDETGLPFFTIDPAGVDGSRPGHAPRAGRRGSPHPVRHRRRADLRPGRRATSTGRHVRGDRRSTARTSGCRCIPRCCPRRRPASFRMPCVRPSSGTCGSTAPVSWPRQRCTARWSAASSGWTTPRSRRRSTPAPVTTASSCSARSVERRIEQERARGGASLPMPEQQVRGGDGRRLHPRVPAARAGGGVERPGVTADGHRRGRDDDRGGSRSASHDAGTHRGCRAAVPPRGARPGCRVGRGTAATATSSGHSTAPTPVTSHSSTRRPPCSAVPGTPRSTERCRRSISTQRWRRRTPT